MEVWRAIHGWEDSYEVSSHGRIRRTVPGKNTYPGKILSPGAGAFGHLHVILCYGGRKQRQSVHRAVAFAFIGKPPCARRTQIAHRDGNPRNNHVDNLYWATGSENGMDQVRHGRAKGSVDPRRQVITDEDVRRIRQDNRPSSQVARDFGLSPSTVTQIRRRETHKHVPRQEGDFEQTLRKFSFTPEQVRCIRADPRTSTEVSAVYACSAQTIWSIRTRKSYAHVDPELHPE